MRKLLLIILIFPWGVQAQSWQWAQTSAGTEQQGATGSTTDRYGNTYMAGYSVKNYVTDTGNSVFFGSCSIISTDMAYDFLVKYSNSGTALWAKKIPYSYNVYVATDSIGEVYITGGFGSSSFTLGSFTVHAADSISLNVYVAKLDSSGNVLWLRSGGGAGGTGGSQAAIACDRGGNVAVAGNISQSVSFGPDTLSAHDLFVVEYDPSGNLLWANAMGGAPRTDSINYGVLFPDWPNSMVIDGSGSVVVTGRYSSDTFFAGADTLINRSGGGNNLFLLKYDTAGHLAWAATAGGDTSEGGEVYDYATSAAVDASGNIYLVGATNSEVAYFGGLPFYDSCGCGQMLFAKYSGSGTFEWLRHYAYGGPPALAGAFGQGVAITKDGFVYVIGQAFDTVYFGPFAEPGESFIVEYDTAGTPISVAAAGKQGYFSMTAVSVDTGNNAFVSGYYFENCNIGSTSLTATGAGNAFLAKYGPDTTTAVGQPKTNKKVTIYPNPATGRLTITAGFNIRQVSINNLVGQVVYSGAADSQSVTLDVSVLVPGMYFIKVNEDTVEKFVKQ